MTENTDAMVAPVKKWQQLDAKTFAVVIDPKTTLGEFALIYFSKRIPRGVRQRWASLRWDGDFWQDGKRWGRIRVTWRRRLA